MDHDGVDLARVRERVRRQVAAPSKPRAAARPRARIRLLARVRARVPCQMAAPRKPRAATLPRARERLLFHPRNGTASNGGRRRW